MRWLGAFSRQLVAVSPWHSGCLLPAVFFYRALVRACKTLSMWPLRLRRVHASFVNAYCAAMQERAWGMRGIFLT
jgi:hypothetical protein